MSKKIIILGSISSIGVAGVVAGTTFGILHWKELREQKNSYKWDDSFINKLKSIDKEDGNYKAFEVSFNGSEFVYPYGIDGITKEEAFAKAAEKIGFTKVSNGYQVNGKIYRDFADLAQFGNFKATNLNYRDELNVFDWDQGDLSPDNTNAYVILNGTTYRLTDKTISKPLNNPAWFHNSESSKIYDINAIPQKNILDNRVTGSVDDFYTINDVSNNLYSSEESALSNFYSKNNSSLPLESSGEITYIDSKNSTNKLRFFSELDPNNPSGSTGVLPNKVDLSTPGVMKSGDVLFANNKWYKYLEKKDTPGYAPANLQGAQIVRELTDNPAYMQNDVIVEQNGTSRRYYYHFTAAQAMAKLAQGVTKFQDFKVSSDQYYPIKQDAGFDGGNQELTIWCGGYMQSGEMSNPANRFNQGGFTPSSYDYPSDKPLILNVKLPMPAIAGTVRTTEVPSGTYTAAQLSANNGELGKKIFVHNWEGKWKDYFDPREREKTNDGYMALAPAIKKEWVQNSTEFIPGLNVMAYKDVTGVTSGGINIPRLLYLSVSRITGYANEQQPNPEGFYEINNPNDVVTATNKKFAGADWSSINVNATSMYKYLRVNTLAAFNNAAKINAYGEENSIYTTNATDTKTGYLSLTKAIAGWFKEIDASAANVKNRYENKIYNESLMNAYYSFDGKTSYYINTKEEALRHIKAKRVQLSTIPNDVEIVLVNQDKTKENFVFVSKTKSQSLSDKFLLSVAWDGTINGIDLPGVKMTEEQFKNLYIFDATPSMNVKARLSGDEMYFDDMLKSLQANSKITVINREMYLNSNGFEISSNSSSDLLKREGILYYNPEEIISEVKVLPNEAIYFNDVLKRPVLTNGTK